MKISASKKQLARIISENGGWRDGAEWAAQDKLAWGIDNLIVLYTNEPSEPKAGGKYWTGKDLGINSSIISNELLTNWYQTKINRDEYFHLYPAPDAEGWIEWKGGECPVRMRMVDVKFRQGSANNQKAHILDWSINGDNDSGDIIAYRLHKPEQPKSTAVGDDETNLAAKEELEALELRESPGQRAKLAKIYAPSIEQLAADYRTKLAIAQQAQEEADSHRCGAEAALEKLYQAGLAIGLDIAIADSEPEDNRKPELVITEWRDLQVGDEIEYLGGTTDSWIGKKGVVQLIDDDESNLKILFRCGEEGESGNPRDWPSTRWLSDFKFIRRP